MKYQELLKQASKNLRWQYDSGAGLQLYGDIPDPTTNHVEYKLKPGSRQLFTLISGYKDGSYNPTPQPQEPTDIRVMCGYERWVQFSPKEWDEMQKANAALMTHSANVLPQALEALKKLEPFLSTRTDLLNNASLNEGRATEYDSACERVREAIVAIENVNV